MKEKEKKESMKLKVAKFVIGKIFHRKKEQKPEKEKKAEPNYFENLERILVEFGITRQNIDKIERGIKKAYERQLNNIKNPEKKAQQVSESITKFVEEICIELQGLEADKKIPMQTVDNKNKLLMDIFGAIQENIANRIEMDYKYIFNFVKSILKNYKASNFDEISETIKLFILCPNRNKIKPILKNNIELDIISKVLKGYNEIIEVKYYKNKNAIDPEKHYIEFIKKLLAQGTKEQIEDFTQKIKVVAETKTDDYISQINGYLEWLNKYEKEGDIEALQETLENAIKAFDEMYDNAPKNVEEEKSKLPDILSKRNIIVAGLLTAGLIAGTVGYQLGQGDGQKYDNPNSRSEMNNEEDQENEDALDVYIYANTTAPIVTGGIQLDVGEKVVARVSSSGRVREILYQHAGELKSIIAGADSASAYLDIFGDTDIYEQNKPNIVKPNLYIVEINYKREDGTLLKNGETVIGTLMITEDGSYIKTIDNGEEIPLGNFYMLDTPRKEENTIVLDQYVGDSTVTVTGKDTYLTASGSDDLTVCVKEGTHTKVKAQDGVIEVYDVSNHFLGIGQPWDFAEGVNKLYDLDLDKINEKIDKGMPSENDKFYNAKIIPRSISSLSDIEDIVKVAFMSGAAMPNTVNSTTQLLFINIDLGEDLNFNLQMLEKVAECTKCPVGVRTRGSNPEQLQKLLDLINESKNLKGIIGEVEFKPPKKGQSNDKDIEKLRQSIGIVKESGLPCVLEYSGKGNPIEEIAKPGDVFIRVKGHYDESGHVTGTDEIINEVREKGYGVVGVVADGDTYMATASGMELNKISKYLAVQEFQKSNMQVDIQSYGSDKSDMDSSEDYKNGITGDELGDGADREDL